jgi:hypothetical protein
MFCPECKSEYVEGITECTECRVPLVEELPPEPAIEYEDFINFKTYSARYEAELAQSVLETNGIETLISSDDAGGVGPALAFTRGVQLLVKEEDIQKAEELLKTLEASQEAAEAAAVTEEAEEEEHEREEEDEDDSKDE